jgi:hypothetical protein
MTKEVGLWMDHREAVVVVVTEEGEETTRIESKVEKQLRRTGRSPLKGPHEAQQVPADDSRERALTGHLNTYYDEIVASIRDAQAILILGPGEAKGEFRKRLEHEGLGGRVVGVETTDKMTDKQIVVRVRQRFPKESAPGTRV